MNYHTHTLRATNIKTPSQHTYTHTEEHNLGVGFNEMLCVCTGKKFTMCAAPAWIRSTLNVCVSVFPFS